MIVQVERYAPLFKDMPLGWIDFDTHAEQTYRVTEAMARFGKTWAYDVQLLAGYPNGTVFDADNKGWELWTYLLWKMGLPRGVAYNLFVLLAHLIVPPSVYYAAKRFELSRWEAWTASLLALLLWFFDGLARWSWYSGAIAFGIVTTLFVLPIALFYAYLKHKRAWDLIQMAALLAIGHLVHPSIFVISVFPMAALYLRARKGLSKRQHAGIWLAALSVVGANAYWLAIAFRFAHYIIDHRPFFVANPSYLLTDFFGLVQRLTVTGLIGNRTGFRLVTLIAAAMMLVLWRRKRDDRFLPFAVGLGFLLAMAYLIGPLWVFRQIQPYRNVVPAAFLATIPAAAFLNHLVKSGAFRGLASLTKWGFSIAAVLGGIHLMSDVFYFLPDLLPPVPPLPTGEALPVTAMGFPGHDDFRHRPPYRSFTMLSEWVSEHDDGQGRFLVDWWVLGEHLAWRTRAPILGGFRERNLQHSDANIFRKYPKGDVPTDELRRYLENYAVRWVILTTERPALEAQTELLEPFEKVGPHRIYRTKVPVSYLAEGKGQVRAEMNQIQVQASDPEQPLVLRFHWLETLRCRPNCTAVREPLVGDRVGLIRILAPHPPDLVVENGY